VSALQNDASNKTANPEGHRRCNARLQSA